MNDVFRFLGLTFSCDPEPLVTVPFELAGNDAFFFGLPLPLLTTGFSTTGVSTTGLSTSGGSGFFLGLPRPLLTTGEAVGLSEAFFTTGAAAGFFLGLPLPLFTGVAAVLPSPPKATAPPAFWALGFLA